jgi:hypothetical protein
MQQIYQFFDQSAGCFSTLLVTGFFVQPAEHCAPHWHRLHLAQFMGCVSSGHLLLQLGIEPIQLLPLAFKDLLHQRLRLCRNRHRLSHRLMPSSPSFLNLGYWFPVLAPVPAASLFLAFS